MPLPTNIAGSYPDRGPGDTAHQEHHDVIHAAVNEVTEGRLSESGLNAAYVGQAEKGAAGGVAPLDAGGKVPEGNLPPGLGGGGTSATAHVPLPVPTYDGNPSMTHPDVLHIPGGWNGYEYWMGFTPYPSATRENPSIAASDDGINWKIPAGLTNPLFTNADAVAAGYDYWADAELALSADGLTLMYYFKGTSTGVNNDILVTTSTDGVTWTPHSVVVSGGEPSPAVVREDDDTFTMWTITGGGPVYRRTSADGFTWSARTAATIPTLPAPYTPWHIDVTKVDGTYHMLLMATTPSSAVDPFRVFHLTSTDGLAWTGDTTTPAVPLTGGPFDAQGHYRCTLQPAASGEAGKFDVWTACIDNTGSNHSSGVHRLGIIRNFDFGDGETWAFPEPVSSVDNIAEGDVMYVLPHQMSVATGTPTLTVVNDWPVWRMTDGSHYLVMTFPPLPTTWHSFKVELLIANAGTLTGDEAFRGQYQAALPGTTAIATKGTDSGTTFSTIDPRQNVPYWRELVFAYQATAPLIDAPFRLRVGRESPPEATFTGDLLLLAARIRRVVT